MQLFLYPIGKVTFSSETTMQTIQGCSLVNLFNTISKMWVLHILRSLHIGNMSFGDIQRSIGSISSKTLSERLKNLQEDGFIERRIVSEQPIKIEYSLTKKGKEFSQEIEKLGNWAQKNGY